MAFFDDRIITSDGTKKRIRVPSLSGGTDRTIYVNGNSSNYRLGNNNNVIYNKVSGREVSTLPLKEFAKTFLWKGFDYFIKTFLFFCILILIISLRFILM